MRVGSNAQATLLRNKPHFPSAKHTWRAAEAQKQSRQNPLAQSGVPTCATGAGQSATLPQLGPTLIPASTLYCCSCWCYRTLDQAPGKPNLYRNEHQEQGYEQTLLRRTLSLEKRAVGRDAVIHGSGYHPPAQFSLPLCTN